SQTNRVRWSITLLAFQGILLFYTPCPLAVSGMSPVQSVRHVPGLHPFVAQPLLAVRLEAADLAGSHLNAELQRRWELQGLKPCNSAILMSRLKPRPTKRFCEMGSPRHSVNIASGLHLPETHFNRLRSNIVKH
ncbi:MAG TPA: hypothetical protein VEG64_13720, partial [Candidatus Sulfotelmatobacter sp.]|nr:hypothetical protein [Candidatus Sulfotelmatobacter sp.]